LHIAAAQNLVAGVKVLLEYNAKTTSVDKNGVSPMLLASVNGCQEVIGILHENGADVNCKDNTGRTPFHAACSDGHTKVVEVLVRRKASQSSQDKEGNIPLQLACHSGHYELVKLLIETGESDIHSLDRNGQTPLHKACKGEDSIARSQLLQYLIQKGGNVNLQSKYKRSPLHCACQDGNPVAAGLLLKGGADVHLVDMVGIHLQKHYMKFPKYYCEETSDSTPLCGIWRVFQLLFIQETD
jgi:ankyrin repeat protein